MNWIPVVVFIFIVITLALIGWVAKDGIAIYEEKEKKDGDK